MLKRLLALAAATAALVAVVAAPALAAPAVNGVFDVADVEINDKIVAGPDGNMWVTVSDATTDVARITPAGEVTAYNLKGVSNPSGIASDGKDLWVGFVAGLGRFSPASPEDGQGFVVPEVKAESSLVLGPDGNLWIATTGAVLRTSPANPTAVTPFAVEGLTPKDIDVAGQNLIVADGGGGNRVLSVTTAGAVTEIPIEGPSQGVAGNPGGQFAYTAPDKGVGLGPPPLLFTAFPGSDTFGATLGADGAYWIAEGFGEKLIRLTTDNRTSELGGLPAGFVSRQIAAGPDNTVWVTVEKPGEEESKVVRISGLEPPAPAAPLTAPVTPPQTRIAKGPKGKVKTRRARAAVKFRFTSPTAGARFQCALVRLPKPKGKKRARRPKPRFKGCKSPRTLRLKPGRYRFEVRAVAAGAVDPTPAKRSFRVVRVKPKRR